MVEADILVRHNIAEYLRACGYLVVEAANSSEARRMISERSSDVAIVLADVSSAEVRGFELAKWVRSTFSHIDVVLAGTISLAAEKIANICEEGPILKKPYDQKLLLDRIRLLLAEREHARIRRVSCRPSVP